MGIALIYAGASGRRIMGATTTTKPQPSHGTRKNGSKETTAATPQIDRSSIEGCSPESAEYFALITQATNDAVRDWDVKTGQLDWPHGLDTLFGYECSEEAQKISFWQRHLHPDDRARTGASIREALQKANHWSGEYRFRCADGSDRLILERALILRNRDGEAVRLVGSLMDITERKQLQDQLVRSQKMEAFGQLAGGVAHDFNNFLTTILGYSDLLLASPGIKGSLAKHLEEIRGAANRAAGLTQHLLAFSRKQALDPRVLEINTVISNLERSLLRLLGENISVTCELHRFKDGGYIKADPNQMTQIILNLAVNARDAMPNGGRLTLTTGSTRIKEDKLPVSACSDKLTPGEYVTLAVNDTGAGMNDETQAHLFEPFFTTKEGEEGTGLGLATSYGIVHQSGGHICVQSEIGRGTTVTIYLPRVPAPPPPAYQKRNSKKAPTGTETILVLEDDLSVRHISVRVLRNLGYDVIEAANPEDAQRLIKQDRQHRIDLLLTDIVMPNMSGRHFADWLRQTSPRTKVIFISGYLDESLRHTDGADGAMFFLPKPFDTDQLSFKVREALDSKK